MMRAAARKCRRRAVQIQRTIKQETGVDLNVHAFRHLAAMLFLREHPREYQTTRVILGHKSHTTTVRAYTGSSKPTRPAV
jgi:integrase